jgi:hypothetical protein
VATHRLVPSGLSVRIGANPVMTGTLRLLVAVTVWLAVTVASLAQQYGKKFSLCVIGGFNAPSWVYQNGPDGNGSAQFTISGTGVSGVMPAPWDPNFHRRWSTFLAAAGATYDALPELAYVIVTGQGWGGQATFCRSLADNAELNADGGINVWINAYAAIVGLYVTTLAPCSG